jgi:hypothetical protein
MISNGLAGGILCLRGVTTRDIAFTSFGYGYDGAAHSLHPVYVFFRLPTPERIEAA